MLPHPEKAFTFITALKLKKRVVNNYRGERCWLKNAMMIWISMALLECVESFNVPPWTRKNISCPPPQLHDHPIILTCIFEVEYPKKLLCPPVNLQKDLSLPKFAKIFCTPPLFHPPTSHNSDNCWQRPKHINYDMFFFLLWSVLIQPTLYV